MVFTPQRLVRSAVILMAVLCAGDTTFAATKKKESSPVSLYTRDGNYLETGMASWYGGYWVGRKTANGEIYRSTDITAAHKKLPFNTLVRVTNLKNGKSTIVRINNRGPYVRGRIIDLSVNAAKKIGVYESGISKVKLEIIKTIPIMTAPNLRLPAATSKPLPSGSLGRNVIKKKSN